MALHNEENVLFVVSEDYDLLLQSVKPTFCKVEILDERYNVLKEVTGNIISGDYSEDSESDIRRTISLSFGAGDGSGFDKDEIVWLDKNVRVKVGVLHNVTDTIRWYSLGTFIYDTVNSSITANSHTINASCVDLIARMNGDHGGMITSRDVLIEAGNNLYNVVKSIAEQCPYIQTSKIIVKKEYMTDDDGEIYLGYPLIPYDLEFGTGTTWLNILTTIRDLYIGYEFYFDDTEFVFQPMETDEYSMIVVPDTYMNQLTISESSAISFADMKNVVQVWGRCYDLDHFSLEDGTSHDASTDTYTLTTDSLEALEDGVLIGFTAPSSSLTGIPKIKVVTSNDVPLTADSDGVAISLPLKEGVESSMEVGRIIEDQSYVLKYKNNAFWLVGNHQICCVAKLVSAEPSDSTIEADRVKYGCQNVHYVVNENSPFGADIEGIGDRILVLSGGDYDNIDTDDLARQRACFELWKATDLVDSISLECIDIPFLHVNQKISYKPNGESVTYIYDVLSKQSSLLQGTMSLKIKKHVASYPWI